MTRSLVRHLAAALLVTLAGLAVYALTRDVCGSPDPSFPVFGPTPCGE